MSRAVALGYFPNHFPPIDLKRLVMNGFQPARRGLLLLALGAALNGCAMFENKPVVTGTNTVTLSGSLDYRSPTALPTDSVAVVKLVSALDGRVLSAQEQDLDGKQAPVEFMVKVPLFKLSPGVDYRLRAEISQRNRALWVSDPVEVRLDDRTLELGALLLHPARTAAFTARLDCGGRSATVGMVQENNQDRYRLLLDDERIELRPTASASGSRYVGIGVAATEVWLNGDKARLTLRSAVLPECTVVNDAATALSLQGVEWVVEDIGGGGVIDNSRATLNFGRDGKLTGRASCNSYTATYTWSGSSLSIGQGASTMMACAPALMDQERRFVDILQGVQRYEFSDTGALVLVDGQGRKVTARH